MSDIGLREPVGVLNSEPSVEVVALASRRRFPSEYKRRILDEVDRASHGEIGLILRREGLYSSQLTSQLSKWRTLRNGMTKAKKNDQGRDNLLTAYKNLEKENARLKLKLRKAQAMLDLQKKAAEIMSFEDESGENERSDS